MFRTNFLFSLLIIFLSVITTSSPVRAAKLVKEGVWINDKIGDLAKEFSKQEDLTIDHKTSSGFELFGPKGLTKWLQKNQISFSKLNKITKSEISNYPTPEEIESELINLTQHYSQISELINVGKSYDGRNLLFVKISNAKGINVPQFKYIANMHGDEIVGRELMVLLIKDLLQNYGKDATVTNLINTTEIYIMPSMNPDGAATAQRGNAQWVDLNRDFPDFTTSDNQETLDGRQVETQAIINFEKSKNFLLSANFHGGAEVVNYPWDTSADQHPKLDLVKRLSLDYASLASYIYGSTVFEHGITNGYQWYEVNGGMQDWSFVWHNDLQLTIELSNSKWPQYSTVDYYYKENREALINFIASVHKLNN